MKSQFEKTLSTWAVADKGNKLSIDNSRLLILLLKTTKEAPFLRLSSHEFYVTLLNYTGLRWFKTFFIEIVLERRLILRDPIFDILRTSGTYSSSIPLRLKLQQVVVWSIIRILLIKEKTVSSLIRLLSRCSFIMDYFQLWGPLYYLTKSFIPIWAL